MGRPKSTKVTWDKVYKDFREKHPKLKDECSGFKPYGYAEILIYGLKDNHYVYNYDTKKVTAIKKGPILW